MATENILVSLIDTSCSFLTDKKQPTIVRVYCIQILKNAARKTPELNEELKQTLLLLAADETSAAIKCKLIDSYQPPKIKDRS